MHTGFSSYLCQCPPCQKMIVTSQMKKICISLSWSNSRIHFLLEFLVKTWETLALWDLYPGLRVIRARLCERQKGSGSGREEMRMAERNIGSHLCALKSKMSLWMEMESDEISVAWARHANYFVFSTLEPNFSLWSSICIGNFGGQMFWIKV